MSYQPLYTITNQILAYVSSISEKIGNISATHNLESKTHLRRNNRIRSIHSSLKIEANSLSLGQVRDVINGKIVLGKQKEIQEVKNAFDAYERIKEIDPYDIEELKKFHGIMTKYVVDISGEFRNSDEGVFDDRGRCIFIAPPPYLVPSLMDDLFNWMQDEKDNTHPLILSCIFHYKFVFIHPFCDGNGRIGRLIMFKECLKYNIVPFIIEDNLKMFYYRGLKEWHNERGYLVDTCLTAQDIYKAYLDYFRINY